MGEVEMTPRQAMDLAREAIRENLDEIAREIIEWQNTGILPRGKLREIAEGLRSVSTWDALGIAEALAQRAAFEAICRQSNHPVTRARGPQDAPSASAAPMTPQTPPEAVLGAPGAAERGL